MASHKIGDTTHFVKMSKIHNDSIPPSFCIIGTKIQPTIFTQAGHTINLVTNSNLITNYFFRGTFSCVFWPSFENV